MTRAVREAKKYAEFREAFGLRIAQFPMLANQIRHIDRSAKRTTAAAFRLYRDFLDLEGGLKGGLVTDETGGMKKKRFAVRELIMLQKMCASWDCTDIIRTAMSVFGGHGVMEDFSCLPRLFRDSAINELWEGPRNVLLTQIHRDFQRAKTWYAPGEFVKNILEGAGEQLVMQLGAEMELLVGHPDLFTMDDATLDVCGRWDSFCQKLYHAYQDCALQEIEGQ
jgi:hypothetical protein